VVHETKEEKGLNHSERLIERPGWLKIIIRLTPKSVSITLEEDEIELVSVPGEPGSL
jgi:hypothetical protein